MLEVEIVIKLSKDEAEHLSATLFSCRDRGKYPDNSQSIRLLNLRQKIDAQIETQTNA